MGLPVSPVKLADCQMNWQATDSRIAADEARIAALEGLVPHQPLLDFMVGVIGMYGPFVADFTATTIGPHAEVTKTVDVSSFIGSKTPVLVIAQNRDGAFMSRVSWRAVRNAGSVDIVAYNNDAANTAAGFIDFMVLA